MKALKLFPDGHKFTNDDLTWLNEIALDVVKLMVEGITGEHGTNAVLLSGLNTDYIGGPTLRTSISAGVVYWNGELFYYPGGSADGTLLPYDIIFSEADRTSPQNIAQILAENPGWVGWLTYLGEYLLLLLVLCLTTVALPWGLSRVMGEWWLYRCWLPIQAVKTLFRPVLYLHFRMDTIFHRLCRP